MTPKIRVLHCLQTIYSGGVERRRLLLATGLSKERYEQKIFCTKALEPLKSEFISKGVEIIEVGDFRSFFELKKYLAVRRFIKRWKPHIVHGAVFEGVSMSVLGSLFNNVPIVITEETSDPTNRSSRANYLLRYMLKAADFSVGISPSVCQYLQKVLHVSKNKLRLINNGVIYPSVPDVAAVKTLREELGIGQTDFVIGSVGRIDDSIKKFSDLIKALSRLNQKYGNLKLLIIGDGKDLDALKQLTAELAITHKVIFAGYQANTALYYKCMDIFVLASIREGFGLVIIEAMLLKLPVIATNVGGIKDIISDKKYGILFDPGDVRAIATAVEKLYLDEVNRESLAYEGYKRASANFTADKYVLNVQKLYEEACQKKGIV
jgi:glycosyltransferase involved in cell wall biosynthesis